ncbi:hypothetical protein [Halotia branconii]|uniref:Uncharacterized protein n=1 Tax=Halotia branconii CENA392 TaxID=1539056 RepID=A0AAJ6NYY0_9CYAN|nr:hypothetical protein [Halotia branconii]WGV29061.1 hypothetical protein QI031_31370 [Halotia branconii CENA392]
MEQNQQVILSIKRTLDTIDGQVINYLQTEPFDLGSLPEIVMLTLLEYWSPFVKSADGVDGEELRQRAIWSIKKLEAQAALIREVFLESHVKTAVIVNNAEVGDSTSDETLVSTSDDQTWDEDTDDLMELELPEEVKQINKLFGVE